jgi:hypothetical protein
VFECVERGTVPYTVTHESLFGEGRHLSVGVPGTGGALLTSHLERGQDAEPSEATLSRRDGGPDLDAVPLTRVARRRRNDTMSRWLVLAVVTGWLLAGITDIGQPAWACSCDRPEFDVQMEGADATFAGQVTNVREDGRDLEVNIGLLAVRIDVEDVWLGDVGEQVVVHTEDSEDACGYTFEAGEGYLVFVHEDEEERLRVRLCSRTAALEEATTDLEALGPGQDPQAARPHPSPTANAATSNDSGGSSSTIIARGSFALVAATFAGVVAWRRRV